MSLLKKQRLKPWNGLKILGGQVCPLRLLQDTTTATTTTTTTTTTNRFSNILEWYSAESGGNTCPEFIYCNSLDLYYCQIDGVDDMATHTYNTPRDLNGRTWRVLDIVRESLPYIGNVVKISNAYVNGLGHVFRNDVQYMHGGCQDFVDRNHGGERVYSATTTTTTVRHIQRAVNLVHLYGDNYYHFMVEILPRFYMTKDWLGERGVKIIVKDARYLHLLRLLGIDYEMLDIIVIKDEDELILVDELIFPVVPRCLHPSYSLFKQMRRDIFLHIHERFPDVRDKIVDDVRDLCVGDKIKIVYLSRRNTPTRRHLLGEDELIQAIRNEVESSSKFEFHVLYGNETITTTLNTLISSSVVFGPHGAAFSNLIFVPTHAFIFEIVPKDYYNPCFIFLSSVLGLRHYAHHGNGTHGTPFEFDDVVNVYNITKWVKAKANVIKRLLERAE